MESEGLHVVVVNDVEAKVEQLLVGFLLRLEHGAYVHFQLVEHTLVDNAIAVDEIAQQSVFFDGSQVLVSNVDASCARSVGLNFIHGLRFGFFRRF